MTIDQTFPLRLTADEKDTLGHLAAYAEHSMNTVLRAALAELARRAEKFPVATKARIDGFVLGTPELDQ